MDPPTTNARSVYVERQNANESGLVPGSPTVAAPSSPAAPQNPALAGEVQTVNYPEGLEANLPASSGEEPSGQEKKTPLRWQCAEPESTSEAAVSAQNSGSEDLTPEELANYRYVYDFSVTPPRKVPVDRPVPPLRTSPAPVPERNPVAAPFPRLVGQTFDPYAPNRQFERRRANLSRTLSTEFDSQEPSPSTVGAKPENIPQTEPVPVTQTVKVQSPALRSGWRVVATPEPVMDLPPAVAEAQPAPVNLAVGTEAKVTESQPVLEEDSALNLLDLPERK